MAMVIPDLVINLNLATFWMNQIIPPLQIAFGTFGNLFNIIIFTRPALRTNPCAIYFLASSINNCLVLYSVTVPRYIAANWHLDPSQINNVLCKLNSIGPYLLFSLVLWFPVLASIDRFLSSSRSVQLRRLSSLPIARKMIVCVIIFFLLIHIHLPIFVKSDSNGYVVVCSIFSYEYFLFFNFFGPFVACILPIIFLCIFGVLMVLNVRRVHNRVVPQTNNTHNNHLRSNDRQLIMMLLVQVLVTVLVTIPYVAVCMYYAFVLVMFKYRLSMTGQAIFNFAYNFFTFLYYTNLVTGFYIYTLTGPKFRVEMKRCLRSGLKSVLTTTGLLRYLSLHTRQVLLDDNQTGHTTNVIIARSKREVDVHQS